MMTHTRNTLMASRKSASSALTLRASSAPKAMMAYARIQREFTGLLGRPVDLVTRLGLKPFIKQDVLDSAEILHAP
jgi:predicted nucleotidyltransferase